MYLHYGFKFTIAILAEYFLELIQRYETDLSQFLWLKVWFL